MAKLTARGLFPPVFTPFNADFSINYAAIPPYLQYLAKKGIKGILVNGTSGEGMSQNVEERKKVAETWVKAAAPLGIHVMVQVGGAPLPDVIDLAKHAESLKVGSILTLPELYFKPQTVDELVSYIDSVAKAAPDTPVLYYHIPVNTHVHINMPQFIAEAKKRIPNFHGLKFTSNDLSEGAETLVAGNGDHAVFLGADTLIAPAATIGLTSSIGTTFNFLPELAIQIVQDASKGNLESAKVGQRKLTDIINIFVAQGTWVPVMKVAFKIFTGIDVGPPRPPLKALTQEQVQSIVGSLKAKNLL